MRTGIQEEGRRGPAEAKASFQRIELTGNAVACNLQKRALTGAGEGGQMEDARCPRDCAKNFADAAVLL